MKGSAVRVALGGSWFCAAALALASTAVAQDEAAKRKPFFCHATLNDMDGRGLEYAVTPVMLGDPNDKFKLFASFAVDVKSKSILKANIYSALTAYNPDNHSSNCRFFDTLDLAVSARSGWIKSHAQGTWAGNLIEHPDWTGGRLASPVRGRGKSGPKSAPADLSSEAAKSLVANAADERTAREAERAKRRAEFEAQVAEHQRKLADYQRQVAEREALITEQNRKHEEARKAAAERLAEHERDVLRQREEYERAKLAADAAAKAQATEIRQVRSLGSYNTEAAARSSLLRNNGARTDLFPITNIQCSTILELGKQKWICTGERAFARTRTTASGQ